MAAKNGIRLSLGGLNSLKAALAGLGAAFIVALPMMIGGNDLGSFVITGLLFLGITVIVLTTLFVVLFRREWKFAIVLALVYALSLLPLVRAAYPLHNETRWVLQGSTYRREVLRQQPLPGEFQHVEWDGWGGPGAGDTTVYLVFDPKNSLENSAKNRLSGKLEGIPCGVSQVHRFRSQWYAVTLYTDTDWTQCS